MRPQLTVLSPRGFKLSAHQVRTMQKLLRVGRVEERRANPTMVLLENYGMAEHRYEPGARTPHYKISRWYPTDAGRAAIQNAEGRS